MNSVWRNLVGASAGSEEKQSKSPIEGNFDLWRQALNRGGGHGILGVRHERRDIENHPVLTQKTSTAPVLLEAASFSRGNPDAHRRRLQGEFYLRYRHFAAKMRSFLSAH